MLGGTMSGTALLERKGGADPASVFGLEHKAAVAVKESLAPKSGILDVDPDKGTVTAIVSVTGIVDNVNDRILPGAYTKTLKTRKPKGVWSHDWKDWVSRTEKIEEYLPGDSRLPTETKDGKPWPKEAGALVVTTRFNMKSDRSKEAFLAVEFFSETDECEWSIGYVVPPGSATKDKAGVRNIKALELFEYSPVLFGAASESMTLSVKSAMSVDAAKHAETMADLRGSDLGYAEALDDGSFPIRTKGDLAGAVKAFDRAADPVEAKAHIVARATVLDALDVLPEEWKAGPAPTAADHRPDPRSDAAGPSTVPPVAEAGTEPAVTLEPVDPPEGLAEVTDEAVEGDEGEDDLTADEDALLDAEISDAAGLTEPEVKALLDDLEAKYDTSPVGTPGGRQNWVDKAGGLPKFIRAIAHALIRKGMDKSKAIATAVNTVKRWAAGGKGVNAKTQAKAVKALAEWEAKKKKGSGGKGNLAKPFGKKSDEPVLEGFIVEPIEEKVAAYDPALEVKAGNLEEVLDLDTKFYGAPSLPGTFEERQHALRMAVHERLRGVLRQQTGSSYPRYEWDDISIVGTYDDHVIASRYKYDDTPVAPGESSRGTESFTIDYEWDGETVTLGEPVPVKLSVVTVVGEQKGIEPVDSMTGLPDMLAEVVEGVKAYWAATDPLEVKAGRVLSNANATRLKAAAEHLFAVMSAAGIEVAAPGDRKPTVDTLHDGEPDSTAPSAAATGKQPLAVKGRLDPETGYFVFDGLPVEEKSAERPDAGEGVVTENGAAAGVPVTTETQPVAETSEPGADVSDLEKVPTDESTEAKTVVVPSPADILASLREAL